MKRLLVLAISFILIFTLLGCKGKSEDNGKSSEPSESQSDGIDIDLTDLSATILYSEVDNMTNNPEGYVGKTVKVKGFFSWFQDETTKKEYFACLINDTSECCTRAIEFVQDGEYKYPDDYPELDTEITVTGIFGSYSEDSNTYIQLTQAKLEY